ncbi:phosphoribosylformylglycinamidine synthase 2 [Oxobacter pfennigii]|uniref:Phosphoribosylformylglycinamidine synthase 2 n=1 Tax=Oxobacter pfennigii TaxID=36849 RepID=A0A0P8WDR9_9CLOT|nr:phosphoribosylformylglycinamidine synthase [Oxobacter pfennigii]KPU45887.1 phosphoribosylformylglycinamidine synthase 2 [Oxobacter pfennigii]
MRDKVRRIFVEKKKGFDVEAKNLTDDIKENLIIAGLHNIRIINRYDISGMTDDEYEKSKYIIFSEPPVDDVYDEALNLKGGLRAFAIEYLPGQYDQRADSAAQCVQILTQKERPEVLSAKVIVIEGDISDSDFGRIKSYCINPIESREASLEKPETLEVNYNEPEDVEVLKGFTGFSKEKLDEFMTFMGLAMSMEDLIFVQEYFKDTEKRDPSITEIRVIDTYWSDHCRHTTFLTNIKEVSIEEGKYKSVIEKVLSDYMASRKYVYGDREKDVSLMDLATISMKELRKKGYLKDLDESEEINACSIAVNVDVDGRDEEWLIMFKNETHNHPTEIEPFGGAATCLGGAIRDPLSGRSYVYQAMRVTGSGDPRTKIEDTLSGKLPQRKITTGAAAGYSSYGNQIGLSTGLVSEVYHPDFVAKRMEIGAVIGAAPKGNVVRLSPTPGDKIILLGGRTGRDGCGGATGSSKEHDEESLLSCGAEVQKGNPPTERKIQRLFRNPEVSKLIKRCNDFGAGGVSVAIGELADGLEIDLDKVPKKYEGLDGTELAISESQERMAVVVSQADVERFIALAGGENLEAVEVAQVTDKNRLKMTWRGKEIVDISRDFLNTNGAKQYSNAHIKLPKEENNYFKARLENFDSKQKSLKEKWLDNLRDLNVCSQKGMVERFDSTIGAGTVLMPFGGKFQLTPMEVMAARIPVLKGETRTGTLMSYGYNPELAKWSPFHGAVYAITEAVTKIVAAGGNYKNIRLTLQEYFEKLGKDPEKWGKPLGALLGSYYTQMKLSIPAIGGKDSMSGTFKDLNVPPTLVAFAVNLINTDEVISGEFKGKGSQVVLIPCPRDEYNLPVFEVLEFNFEKITELINKGKVLSSYTVRLGGIAEAVSKMSFGNSIGFDFAEDMEEEKLFSSDYGSIILEIPKEEKLDEILRDVEYKLLGHTTEDKCIKAKYMALDLDEAVNAWMEPLEKVFPTKAKALDTKLETFESNIKSSLKPRVSSMKPRIFIPVFPGTNCEYDTARAFEKAGGTADIFVVKNLTPKDIEETLNELCKRIESSQIIAIPGGFSGGDEPDGSGKFIATALRNPKVKDAVMNLLKNRDGLMIGICNGFQALIKLGLVPYGEVRDIDSTSPTLTFNTLGRHISRMVQTKIASTASPWFNNVKAGDVHTVAVSHGEGRFWATEDVVDSLVKNGQIATQYVDFSGKPTMDISYNPNGSICAIEGITSPDGRILGKMGHSERAGYNVFTNIPGDKDQKIFKAGVDYFKI